MFNHRVRNLAVASFTITSAAAFILLAATGASASTVADASPGHTAVAVGTAVRTVPASSTPVRETSMATPAEEEWLFAGNFDTWEGCAAAGAAYYASGEAIAFYCEEESNPVTGVYGYLLWILANVVDT